MNKKITDKTFIIFTVISFIYAIGNFVWWQLNTPVIPSNISAVHFFDIFNSGWLFNNAPLLTYIMRFMFSVFGKEHYDLIIIFVNYIFFLIPLYFIYEIGKELKDKETGNMAMILFALSPAVYGLSRQYGHQDYHIMAAITFNIYCLIKSDYFRDRKWSVIYGASVGLGLMVKDSFTAYFFVPFAYAVFVSLKVESDAVKFKNIATAVIIGSLIACCHYFRPVIIDKIIREPVIRQVSVFSFENLRVMTIGLWEELLSLPVFIVFIVGLVYFIRKYFSKNKNLILLWFTVPWLIIMFMPHSKISEYGAGLIPATALIGAVFINSFKNKLYKKIIAVFIIISGVFLYFDFSYRTAHFLNFNIIGRDIKYFNGRLMCYDKKDSEFASKTVQYLNQFYKNNSLCIEDCPMLYCCDKYFMIASLMKLKGFDLLDGYVKDERKVLNRDILIIVGKSEILEGTLDSRIKRIRKLWFDESYISKTKDIFDEVKQNYETIDVFYPFGAKDEEFKVTLLAKKNKI